MNLGVDTIRCSLADKHCVVYGVWEQHKGVQQISVC